MHLLIGLDVIDASLEETAVPKSLASRLPSAVSGTSFPVCPSGISSLMECLMISAVAAFSGIKDSPRMRPSGIAIRVWA